MTWISVMEYYIIDYSSTCTAGVGAPRVCPVQVPPILINMADRLLARVVGRSRPVQMTCG